MKPAAAPVRLLMPLTFFLVFAGGGALQGYLKNVLPDDWSRLKVTSVLAVLYSSFLVWRLLIPASQRLFGDKRSMVLSAAAYAIVPCLLFFTTNHIAVTAGAVVWGWGAAGLWQTGPVWLYDATGQARRGFWAGVLYSAVFLALMIGAKVQGYLAPPAHDRTALLGAALAPALAAVLVSLALPARKATAEALRVESVLALVVNRRIVILGAMLLASGTSYGLLLGAFRDSIQEKFGVQAVGTILAAYFCVRLLVSIIGGYLSDVFPRRAVIAVVFLSGGAALAAAAAFDRMWAFIAGAGSMGLISAVVPVSTTAFSGDWFAPEKRSLALGAAFIWRDAGMVASLLSAQYLVQVSGGYKLTMLTFAALFAACGLVSFALPARDEPGREACGAETGKNP